jgi:hypothetical protein
MKFSCQTCGRIATDEADICMPTAIS